MSDNPAMTPEKIAKAEAKFSGVFYRRYILGEWVRAEGAIYTQFADNTEMFLADECSENLLLVTVGIDYGASRSKTVFKASGFTNGFKTVYALAERDITGVKDPETIYKEFERFYRGIVAKYHKCQYVFADYGALGQVLTNGLQRYCCSHNIPCQISDCSKGRIFDRIELTTQLMAQGRLKILRQNKNLIKAFQEAVWDEKHEDERLDDGTSDIDSLDAFEYSIFPYYNNLI